MQTNPPLLLLDTNVWLDYFLPFRTGRGEILTLFREAEAHGAALAFASQSALDVFQQTMCDNKRWVRESGSLTKEMAIAIKRLSWDYVNEMRELATAVPVDATDLYLACKFRDVHDDLEDDLVLAACERSRANYLVTNDRALLAHAPIDARTPQQMTELLQTGRAKGTPLDKDNANDTRWLYEWLAREG